LTEQILLVEDSTLEAYKLATSIEQFSSPTKQTSIPKEIYINGY
jgi:hypothetical protein